MKNRILIIGKPPDWLNNLIDKDEIVRCEDNPDAILIFEENHRAQEIIEKYRRRYIPIIAQINQLEDKGIFILSEEEINAKKNLRYILKLQRVERERNPLTKLPGNEAINEHIEKHLLSPDSGWLGYVDMNNFKVYNDRYGFGMGDRLIVNLAKILEQCIGDNFIGHIGGDDFVFIIKEKNIRIIDSIACSFDQSLSSYYPEIDLKRNEIIGIDRLGEEKKFGLVHLAIVVLTQKYNNFQELNYAAAIIKNIAKEQSKNENRSLWVWDRDINIWHRDNLMKILNSDDKITKRTAIEVLGEIADETNLDLFINLLKSEDFLIRKSAAYALGRIVKQEVVTPLLTALNDSSPHVRMRTAEALGSFYDSKIPDALLKTLHDKNVYVREATIKSIGKLKIKDALPMLLDTTNERLLPTVLNTLGEIGDARALPFIEKILSKKKFSRYVIDALSKIMVIDSLKILINLLADNNETLKAIIYKAIYNFSKMPAMRPVIEAKNDSIIEGLGLLNPYYPIMILYEIEDTSINEKIKTFVKDESAYIRRAAVLYLGNMQKNLNIIADILIKDKAPLVRQTAANVLTKLGKPGLPFLRKALKDPDLKVRKSAAQAILRILF